MNGDAFLAYVEQVLVPTLAPGDIVVMDNLRPTRGRRPRGDRGGRRASSSSCRPTRPDFNPIENAFSKLKALLRKAAARTIDALVDALGRLIDTFTPDECANYFTAAGYEPD